MGIIYKSNKNFDISIPKHMYWSSDLKNPKKCPKCNLTLKKEMQSFFVIVNKDTIIMGCNGLFCSKCLVIVLDNNELGDMIHSYSNKDKFKIYVGGIINLDDIPENKKNIPIDELDPLPIVAFKNFSNREEHDKFIEDKSVFKERDIKSPANNSSFRDKKIGRNEPCPCGSGKKYKKCCLK